VRRKRSQRRPRANVDGLGASTSGASLVAAPVLTPSPRLPNPWEIAVTSDAVAIARALTESARLIHTPRSLEDTLDAIVNAAREAVPGFDHIGISAVHKNGKIETQAGTDQLVWDLDTVQYDLDEGPCVSSVRGDTVVRAEHLSRDDRWPRYVPHAVRAGVRAQLGLRLYVEDETIGGLNLYSSQVDAIPEDAVEVAELFATHAALALGRARYEHNLNQALVNRKTIGQALGLIMQRYQIDEERAFQFLARASATSEMKLFRVAQEVVETANDSFARRSPTADGRATLD
jgi:GAF domain-containing protein